jgi:hypothetical protein
MILFSQTILKEYSHHWMYTMRTNAEVRAYFYPHLFLDKTPHKP